MKKLNEALRLIRVFHDMNAKDLAAKLDISVAQLSKIEKSKATPQMSLIEKYAKVFDTTPAALLLFSEDLDKEKNRGRFKIAVRNSMLKLLKALEGLTDIETRSKNSARK